MWNFDSKSNFFLYFLGFNTKIAQKKCEEFATCLCRKIGAVCLSGGFLFNPKLMMTVIAISLALPLNLFESPGIARKCKLIKISFQKLLSWYYNYHNHLGNCPQFFNHSSACFVCLTSSILSAKTDLLDSVDFVVWKELKKTFVYFFLKKLFFAMLGILSIPLFLWLKYTALYTSSETWPLLTTIIPLNRYLNTVLGQSTCWYVKQKGSSFCSNSSTLPGNWKRYL